MGTRLKVLSIFKALHRTRMAVFKDDPRALEAARLQVNEGFKKNKTETDEENIRKMIKMGSDVDIVLRETVIQGEHIAEDKIRLRPRDSLLLENVPYSDLPREEWKGKRSRPTRKCGDAPTIIRKCGDEPTVTIS